MLSMELSAYYDDLSSQPLKWYPSDSIKSTHKGYQLLAGMAELNCGIQMIRAGIFWWSAPILKGQCWFWFHLEPSTQQDIT